MTPPPNVEHMARQGLRGASFCASVVALLAVRAATQVPLVAAAP